MTIDNVSDELMARLNRLQEKATQLPDPTLIVNSPGDTLNHMTTITREEMDAKLSATEARIEASLTRMESRLAHAPTTGQLWLSAASSVLAVAGLVAAFLAFGSDRFNGGLSVGIATVDRKLGIEQVLTENAAQTKQIEMLSNQVDQVLQAISRDPQKQSGEPMPQLLPVPAN